MYKFKRVSAYVIDITLLLISVALFMKIDMNQLAMVFTQGMIGFTAPSVDSIILTVIIPVSLFGIMTGVLGKTPGKMLMRLRVCGLDSTPVGIKKGLIREAIKCAAFTCLILGIPWALYGLFTEGSTFYDDWLGLSVDDESVNDEDELTEVQKSWREFHGDA